MRDSGLERRWRAICQSIVSVRSDRIGAGRSGEQRTRYVRRAGRVKSISDKHRGLILWCRMCAWRVTSLAGNENKVQRALLGQEHGSPRRGNSGVNDE